VAAELGRSLPSRESATRVQLPLFGNPKGKPADVSNEDLARALAQDDVAAARRTVRQRSK
jgi:hypothetical protein